MKDKETFFELNDTILERIIFAMEDQTRTHLIDLRNGELVQKTEETLPDFIAPPPQWTPADGFRIMETFCSRVKNLKLKSSLMKSLSHGKGVFKAFRTVLAEFPQEEIQFRAFKNAALRHHIVTWVDDMRESIGFSRLGPEPDEFCELIDEEFLVRTSTLVESGLDIHELIEAAQKDSIDWLPVSVAQFEKSEVSQFFKNNRAETVIHYIHEEGGSPIAIAAGSILRQNHGALGLIRFFYITKEFRTLGLELRLVDSIENWCRKSNVESILFQSLFLHPSIADQFQPRGLKTVGSLLFLG
jgi:hypothetical protein